MYIEEVKKPSTADCFKDGMKLRSVEEKFLKLGLCCKTWDSWLDELYLLGKTSHLIFSIFSFIRREHFAAIKVRLLSEMTVVYTLMIYMDTVIQQVYNHVIHNQTEAY